MASTQCADPDPHCERPSSRLRNKSTSTAPTCDTSRCHRPAAATTSSDLLLDLLVESNGLNHLWFFVHFANGLFVCLFVCKRVFLGLSVWFFLTFHKPVACFSPPSIKPVRSTGKHLVSNHCYDKLQTTDPTQKPRSTPQTQTKTADPTQKPSVTNTTSIVMYYARQIRKSRTLLYILRPRRVLQRLHANSLT